MKYVGKKKELLVFITIKKKKKLVQICLVYLTISNIAMGTLFSFGRAHSLCSDRMEWPLVSIEPGWFKTQ